MIWWETYKKLKPIAEAMIKNGNSDEGEVNIEINAYVNNGQSYDITVENVINILSGGEHYRPLHDFDKIGKQINLFGDKKEG